MQLSENAVASRSLCRVIFFLINSLVPCYNTYDLIEMYRNWVNKIYILYNLELLDIYIVAIPLI